MNGSNKILANPLLKINDPLIPILDQKRIIVINCMLYTLINAPLIDSHYTFFEQLARILLHSDNLRVFKNETIGFPFLLDLLINSKVKSAQNNLYIQILSTLERFI